MKENSQRRAENLAKNNYVTFRQPDDWHLHLREGEILKEVALISAKHFARALIMPNLKEPITTAQKALKYRDEILQATHGQSFQPLMTCYLQDETSPESIREGVEIGVYFAAKLYPANATTGSSQGVTDISNLTSVFEEMQKLKLPLCVHGEVTDPKTDIFDREKIFIEKHLTKIRKNFPELKIVFEHITTKEGVDFVKAHEKWTAASVTAHHLWLNRNALFEGGIRPHHYCLPVLKREVHRRALIEAATSGDTRFFLGTDSAPHLISQKESSCGCAGIFSSETAIPTYLEIFEREQRLQNFEAFASTSGAAFYGVEVNAKHIHYEKKTKTAPIEVKTPFGAISHFRSAENLKWSQVL